MDGIYQCNSCGWIGIQDELEWVVSESCDENEEAAVCPECGNSSFRVERQDI